MKSHITILMAYAISASVGNANVIPLPFKDFYETEYSDDGKTLMRLDMRHEGEFVVEDGTETIGFHAFFVCESLTSVVIPDSVTNIMAGAFNSCTSLTNVVFGSGLRTIDDWAFRACDNLKRIEFPDSLEKIGNNVFAFTPIEEVRIGSGLRSVEVNTFGFEPLNTNAPSRTTFAISPSNRWLRVEDGRIVPIKKKEVSQ